MPNCWSFPATKEARPHDSVGAVLPEFRSQIEVAAETRGSGIFLSYHTLERPKAVTRLFAQDRALPKESPLCILSICRWCITSSPSVQTTKFEAANFFSIGH